MWPNMASTRRCWDSCTILHPKSISLVVWGQVVSRLRKILLWTTDDKKSGRVLLNSTIPFSLYVFTYVNPSGNEGELPIEAQVSSQCPCPVEPLYSSVLNCPMTSLMRKPFRLLDDMKALVKTRDVISAWSRAQLEGLEWQKIDSIIGTKFPACYTTHHDNGPTNLKKQRYANADRSRDRAFRLDPMYIVWFRTLAMAIVWCMNRPKALCKSKTIYPHCCQDRNMENLMRSAEQVESARSDSLGYPYL